MGLKRCPYCFEKIKEEAILCKHCKSSLVHTDNEGKDIKDEITENKAQINVQTEQLYDKRTAEFVMGLIGGIIGVIGGFFSIFIGGFGSAFGAEGMEILGNLGISAIIFSIIGIVGAALANSKGKLSGLLMLVATLGGIISISAYYILPGILLLIAAIMILKKPNQNGDKFKWLIWIPSCIGLMAIVFAVSFILKPNQADPVIETPQYTQTQIDTPSNTPVATPTPTPTTIPTPTSTTIINKDTTAIDWIGSWLFRSNPFSLRYLVIELQTEKSISFRLLINEKLEYDDYGFVMHAEFEDIEGIAEINGNNAIYEGQSGKITFMIQDGVIRVSSFGDISKKIDASLGNDTENLVGELIPLLVEIKYFTIEEDAAFRELVQDDYEDFSTVYMSYPSNDIQNIDDFDARVYEGFIKHLPDCMIIMIDENCNIWAAIRGSDDKGKLFVKYFTNTGNKREMPKTIENWNVWDHPVHYFVTN